MRGKLLLTALGAVTLAAPVQTARATDIWSGSGCGGVGFMICASWSLALNSGTYHLQVTNTDGVAPDSWFTQFGLGQAADANLTFAVASGTSTGWGVVSDIPGGSDPFNGMGMLYFVFDANTTNGVNNATGPGETTDIFFTVTGGTGTFDPSQIGIHAQAGPNDCSAKAVFNGTGGDALVTDYDPACGGTTVPEPATLALVGTGIAGILAARRRHRVMKD